jgi:hypothetical protein
MSLLLEPVVAPDEKEVEIPVFDDEVLDTLIRARALVDTPEKWVKGMGRVIRQDATKDAVWSICVGTAIAEASGLVAPGCGTDVLWDKAVSSFCNPNGIGRIPQWNDHPWTCHADVLAAFDRAIHARKTWLLLPPERRPSAY